MEKAAGMVPTALPEEVNVAHTHARLPLLIVVRLVLVVKIIRRT